MPSNYVWFYGERLKKARARKGLTQEQFADYINATQPEISDYEREKIGCYINRAKKIIDFLDETYDNLIREEIPGSGIKEKTSWKLCYEEHFDYISNLWKNEFEQLNKKYWINLNVVNIKKEDYRTSIDLLEAINQCIKSNKNAVILGDSGSGKTFACLMLFKLLKEEYLNSKETSEKKIPLFVELSQIMNNKLSELLKETVGELKFNEDKEKYIIFLDGLNEVGDLKEQQKIFSQIERFALLNPNTRLIITTQTIDTSLIGSSEFMIYEIKSLKRDDIIDYLSKFKDKFETKRETELFYNNLPDPVKNFISIPIFLNIMVSSYEKDKFIKINNPGELLSKYENFLCGSRRPLRINIDEVYRKHIIPFLAFNMCKNNEKKITWMKFNEYIEKSKKKSYSSSIDEGNVKDAVLNRFKIMRRDENDNLQFVHQTIRDYFAAVYMKNAKYIAEDIIKIVYNNSHKNDNLINAVKLLVGIVKPNTSKEIIRNFIDKDLFLTCTLFSRSSIDKYDEELLELIKSKIFFESDDKFIYTKDTVSFYIKYLDLLIESEKIIDKPYIADKIVLLGNVICRKAEYEKAIIFYKKAIVIYDKNDMQNHPNYAACLLNLGTAYFSILEYNKAKVLYEEAISIFEKNKMQEHPIYADCCASFGNISYISLEYDEALKLYGKAFLIYKKNDMLIHPKSALCLMNIGKIYTSLSEDDKSIEFFEEAISIFQYILTHNKNNSHFILDYVLCLENLGMAYNNRLESDKAIDCFEKAVSLSCESHVKNHPTFANCLMNLGVLYANKQKFNKAIKLYKNAILIYKNNNMRISPNYALCFANLGVAYSAQGKITYAIRRLKIALSIFEKSLGKDHFEYQKCLKVLDAIVRN